MKNSDPTREIIRRTQRYWYADGLSELAGGAVIALLGLYYYILGHIPAGGTRAWLMGLGLPALLILASIAARWVVARLKERLTYPRTGFVAYARPGIRRRILFSLLSAGVAAVFVFLTSLLLERLSQNLLPILVGFLFGLLVLYLAFYFGVTRFYLVALGTFLLGLLTAWLSLPAPFDSALFFGGAGLMWILSGGLTLARYLRSTTPAGDDEVGE